MFWQPQTSLSGWRSLGESLSSVFFWIFLVVLMAEGQPRLGRPAGLCYFPDSTVDFFLLLRYTLRSVCIRPHGDWLSLSTQPVPSLLVSNSPFLGLLLGAGLGSICQQPGLPVCERRHYWEVHMGCQAVQPCAIGKWCLSGSLRREKSVF